ncbi:MULTISPECIES: GAF domain-containing protein [Anaeromyxobacter]|uniref:GAF domain-containing protein n=1 Tax=Anaeromyxobacter TaxID=161492 RepID=UPI001F590871|nr:MULTISPECIES: GAF domain-containing protein [unclassified Anaeromyxobacter]
MADPRDRTPPPPPAAAGQDLQKMSERLREVITSLRSEQQRLASEATTPVPGRGAPSDPGEHERRRLTSELALAHEAIAHANAERDRLRARVEELEAEQRRLSDDYVAAQERTTELAQLFVALERLHGGRSRADVVAAVQEIVINVVGSEELALFERRGDSLDLLKAFGVDPGPIHTVAVGEGIIGRAASSGATWIAGRDPAPEPCDPELSACIPLRAGDATVGALAIWRLLGHKPILDEQDHAVFDLLSTHAGLALALRA